MMRVFAWAGVAICGLCIVIQAPKESPVSEYVFAALLFLILERVSAVADGMPVSEKNLKQTQNLTNSADIPQSPKPSSK